MALPQPRFVVARGVFELANPGPRTPDQDEAFIRAVQEEFPNVASRQLLPPGVPPSIPYLALQSTASRLAISPVGSELETRFYGDDYVADADRCLQYLGRKLDAILAGWLAIERPPSFLGVVTTLNLSFADRDDLGRPAQFILERHLRQEIDPDNLQDAQLRLSLRAGETHFATLAVANYESRMYERPVFSGQQLLQVRPWEGRVDDTGIELTVDVNNKLALINQQGEVTVDADQLHETMALLRRIIERAPEDFVEQAALDPASLTREGT